MRRPRKDLAPDSGLEDLHSLKFEPGPEREMRMGSEGWAYYAFLETPPNLLERGRSDSDVQPGSFLRGRRCTTVLQSRRSADQVNRDYHHYRCNIRESD